MFDSSVVDVGIGLVFVYLLLSTAVSAAKEGLEAIFKRRGQDLEKGIKELIGISTSKSSEPEMAREKADVTASNRARSEELAFLSLIYDHPLINSLYAGKYSETKKRNLPSYIPSRNFALALLDLYKQGSIEKPTVKLPDKVEKAFVAFNITAKVDETKTLRQIEDWYNSSMDRVAGWYKRRTQWWILAIAVVMTVASNTDTVLIAKRLSTDKTLREAAAKAALNEANGPRPTHSQPQDLSQAAGEGTQTLARNQSPAVLSDTGVKTNDSIDDSIVQLKASVSKLDGVGLPIGWSADVEGWKKGGKTFEGFRQRADFAFNTYSHVPGWIITILAISLGAPFWFDVLNKFMVVRSTVKPHEKSQEEKSKDGVPAS